MHYIWLTTATLFVYYSSVVSVVSIEIAVMCDGLPCDSPSFGR